MIVTTAEVVWPCKEDEITTKRVNKINTQLAKMSCCAAKTAEDRLEPYELRTLYVRQIKRLAQRGLFGQAISVFREVG